jgi:hypothetical protein
MTSQISDNHEQFADLLPAYATGQLEQTLVRQVGEHLFSCAVCQRELADWVALQRASRLALATTSLPSPQLMDGVWARIDAPGTSTWWSPASVLRRLWLVFRAQIPLLPRSIWVVSALVCLFGFALTLAMAFQVRGFSEKHAAGDLLVLFIVVGGASGCAFLYGASVDPGFEWTIATPTSMRLLMLCRMLIVLGYNLALGVVASAAFAAVAGSGLWGMMQLWLGPLLFLSSLCLAISLFLGSTVALICAVVVEFLQNLPANITTSLTGLALPALKLDPTSPLLLLATALLMAFVLFFLPRQPRLAS